MLGLLCCLGFSLIERQTFIEVQRPLSVVASLVAEMGFSVLRLQESQLLGSKAQAQQLWPTGLVAPWHVRSSHIRHRTHVSFIGRQILYH